MLQRKRSTIDVWLRQGRQTEPRGNSDEGRGEGGFFFFFFSGLRGEKRVNNIRRCTAAATSARVLAAVSSQWAMGRRTDARAGKADQAGVQVQPLQYGTTTYGAPLRATLGIEIHLATQARLSRARVLSLSRSLFTSLFTPTPTQCQR